MWCIITTMKFYAFAVVAVTLVLTGCSGDSEPSVSSGQDVADLIGCTGWSNTSEEIYVSEGGSCQLDGQDVGVYYFADDEARDNYVDAASAFGGNYLIGDGWVVDAPAEVLDELEQEYGGERSAN